MVSTFSVPEDSVYPAGNTALYTCPGKANAGEVGFVAIGSYGQCDGGLCFTSTRNKNVIICSCPISTNCDLESRTELGYQISGGYDPSVAVNGKEGGCSPEDCEMCSAGEIKKEQCGGNPLSDIAEGTIVPVGAPAGSAEILACILLDGNVPKTNSCLCQCLKTDKDGNCEEWTVIDQSPQVAVCGQ